VASVNLEIDDHFLEPMVRRIVEQTIQALGIQRAEQGKRLPRSAPAGERLLLKPREAAEFLGLSERVLWDLTAPRGDLPCVRVGLNGQQRKSARFVRYDVEDLRAWIARHKNGTKSKAAGKPSRADKEFHAVNGDGT
jgi:predicted DNA-binding transcriptional regulator AlpA